MMTLVLAAVSLPQLGPPSDEDRSTESSAWSERLEALRQPLLAQARKILRSRYFGSGAPLAEDLVQRTLMRLARSDVRDDLIEHDEERLRRYAYRVLHNLFIDSCTRKKRELLSDEGAPVEPPDDEASPEDALLAKEALAARRRALAEALEHLDGDERAFVLACFRHGSAPAAQQEIGWPPGSGANACQRRNRILRRLQARVDELRAQEERP